MNLSDKILPNPYIILSDELVTLNCGNKTFQFAVNNIRKIHIRKHRPNYFSALMGKLLFINHPEYYLLVRTYNEKSHKIRINTLERYYCIQLISALRHAKSKKPKPGFAPATALYA